MTKTVIPGVGHNSGTSEGTSIAGAALKSIIERVERLNEDKKAVADDIKEVFAEAKSQGFDNAVIRKIIAERKISSAERAEFEAMKELYEQALGLFG